MNIPKQSEPVNRDGGQAAAGEVQPASWRLCGDEFVEAYCGDEGCADMLRPTPCNPTRAVIQL